MSTVSRIHRASDYIQNLEKGEGTSRRLFSNFHPLAALGLKTGCGLTSRLYQMEFPHYPTTILIAGDGRILHANRSAAELLQTPIEKLTTLNVRDFVKPVYLKEGIELIEGARRQKGRSISVVPNIEITTPNKCMELKIRFEQIGKDLIQLELDPEPGLLRKESIHSISMINHTLKNTFNSLHLVIQNLAMSCDSLPAILGDNEAAKIEIAELSDLLDLTLKNLNQAITASELSVKYARIKLQDRLPLQDVFTNLAIVNAVKQTEVYHLKKNVNILFPKSMDHPQVWVKGNSDALGYVLYNLLHNAIKFTPDGKTITITALKTGREVAIEITDQGVGIAPERIPLLFDRNTNQSTSDTENRMGTAQGLPDCREAMEKMGGRIEVTSVPNEGATFRLILPRGTPQ